MQDTQDAKQAEQERLQVQAREEKKVPVIVTLNADKLNSAEIGAGFGMVIRVCVCVVNIVVLSSINVGIL